MILLRGIRRQEPRENAGMRRVDDHELVETASQYMLLFRTPRAEPMLSADNYSTLVNIVLEEGLKTGAFAIATFSRGEELERGRD